MRDRQLLPEDFGERADFDRSVKQRGDGVMMHMAGYLATWGKMEAGAGRHGSYGKLLIIMANECAKAHEALKKTKPGKIKLELTRRQAKELSRALDSFISTGVEGRNPRLTRQESEILFRIEQQLSAKRKSTP